MKVGCNIALRTNGDFAGTSANQYTVSLLLVDAGFEYYLPSFHQEPIVESYDTISHNEMLANTAMKVKHKHRLLQSFFGERLWYATRGNVVVWSYNACDDVHE